MPGIDMPALALAVALALASAWLRGCGRRAPAGAAARPSADPNSIPTGQMPPSVVPPRGVDLAALVAAANHCRVAADCESVGSICGVGCYPLVNSVESERVRQVVRDEVARSGLQCMFSCTAPRPIRCADGRCVMGN